MKTFIILIALYFIASYGTAALIDMSFTPEPSTSGSCFAAWGILLATPIALAGCVAAGLTDQEKKEKKKGETE